MRCASGFAVSGGCRSSTTRASITASASIRTAVSTRVGSPSCGESRNVRLTLNNSGLGNRAASSMHNTSSSASHANMNPIRRGCQNAGIASNNPAQNNNNALAVRPNPAHRPSRPIGFAAPLADFGINVCILIYGLFALFTTHYSLFLLRHRRRCQHIIHHAVRIHPLQLSLRPQHQPMPQHRHCRLLHIIRHHKVATLTRRHGLRHQQQGSACARAGSQRNRRPLARSAHDSQQVVEDRRLNAHGTNLMPRLRQHRKRHRFNRRVRKPRRLRRRMMPLQHHALVRDRRISHLDLQQKPIQLRLRQRIRAFKLHRILRRKHREELIQRVPLAIRRHLPLFHRLEQRSLRARRHAVDLIRQKKLGKHRPLMKREFAGLRREHARPENICGHHVRRALHAPELESEKSPQRLHRERLRHTGHALHQRMSAAKHRQQRLCHRLLLPCDDTPDLLLSTRKQLVCRRYSFSHSPLLILTMFINNYATLTVAASRERPLRAAVRILSASSANAFEIASASRYVGLSRATSFALSRCRLMLVQSPPSRCFSEFTIAFGPSSTIACGTPASRKIARSNLRRAASVAAVVARAFSYRSPIDDANSTGELLGTITGARSGPFLRLKLSTSNTASRTTWAISHHSGSPRAALHSPGTASCSDSSHKIVRPSPRLSSRSRTSASVLSSAFVSGAA